MRRHWAYAHSRTTVSRTHRYGKFRRRNYRDRKSFHRGHHSLLRLRRLWLRVQLRLRKRGRTIRDLRHHRLRGLLAYRRRVRECGRKFAQCKWLRFRWNKLSERKWLCAYSYQSDYRRTDLRCSAYECFDLAEHYDDK